MRFPRSFGWFVLLCALCALVFALWFVRYIHAPSFRAALPPDVSGRPPYIVTTNPYPVIPVSIGSPVRIMMASLKKGYATQLPDGTLQTLPIQSAEALPPGMSMQTIRIDVPTGASVQPVEVRRLEWTPTTSHLGDHRVTLTSSVTIAGITYTADPLQITFRVFDPAGGGIDELTTQQILQRLVDRNLVTVGSVAELVENLTFERVYRSMKANVLLAALIRNELIPGYASSNAKGEASRLMNDLRVRGVDVAHLRQDGMLTKLAAMTGSLTNAEPALLTGSHLKQYRYWDAPLVAKERLRDIMGSNTGAFLTDFAPRDLIGLFDDAIDIVPSDPFRFYVTAWVPERLKTVSQPGFCPILPPHVNGDPDANQAQGRMLCAPKMRPTSSIEGMTTFINSARSGDEAINDVAFRSIARRMALELKKMPPGHRILGMHGHLVEGELRYLDANNQPATVDVKFEDGLTDYIYPRNYPDVSKRFQPYQKTLIWMDEWRNIVRGRMERFFPMLREEIIAAGASLDGMYVDVENKSSSLQELGGHANPSYTGPDQDVYAMLRSDVRWPEVSRQLADAGVCPLNDDGICPITASLVSAWLLDERHSRWNAIMEKRRAEYVNDAIAVPLHAAFPDVEFFNYGNYNRTAFHPFANCNRFSDSCFGIGSLMGTHQNVNLYGYIRDAIMPGQSLQSGSGARIQSFEASNGTAIITVFPRDGNAQFGTLNVADLRVNDVITFVNTRFGCLDAPYVAPQCPPPPGGTTSCTPGTGSCSLCAKALLQSNGCTMPETAIIRPGNDPYFGSGFGTGEYLVQSVNPMTNSITIAYPFTVPRIDLREGVSTTIWVRKQHFRTSTHSTPQSEIKVLRMGTFNRLSRGGVNGSGVAIILSEPVEDLRAGQFLYVSSRSGTDFLPTQNGSQVPAHPYEGKYEILDIPNGVTILAWTGASLQPVDLRVANTASLYANFWRSWNAFVSDIMQMRSMAASTTHEVNVWVQHVDTTTEKNTSDRNDDSQLGDADDPWKYYSEAVFHEYLLGANRVLDWIWSKFSDDSVIAGNDLLNRTVHEVESLVGYKNRRTLSLEPVRWTDAYILTGMEAGGRRVWRLTPNELMYPKETWRIVNTSPAQITLGSGGTLVDVPLPPNAFVCTPSFSPAPCPQNPVSSYGYWIIQYQSSTLLRGSVDDVLMGLQ